jgi:hypothetical protein
MAAVVQGAGCATLALALLEFDLRALLDFALLALLVLL